MENSENFGFSIADPGNSRNYSNSWNCITISQPARMNIRSDRHHSIKKKIDEKTTL